MELMADPIGLVAATAVNGYPPYGCDPLDVVGAGVGLGAGAGGVVGAVIVGAGFGAAEVEWLPAGELAVPLGAAAERELADAEAPGWVELCAEAEGDAPCVRVPADVGAPLELLPVADVVLDVVPAALCAAVLANRVESPNAVIALSSVARHVRRDRRRSPVSRFALRLRCLTGETQPGLRLRAHQDRASGLLRTYSWLRSPPGPAAERRPPRPHADASWRP